MRLSKSISVSYFIECLVYVCQKSNVIISTVAYVLYVPPPDLIQYFKVDYMKKDMPINT